VSRAATLHHIVAYHGQYFLRPSGGSASLPVTVGPFIRSRAHDARDISVLVRACNVSRAGKDRSPRASVSAPGRRPCAKSTRSSGKPRWRPLSPPPIAGEPTPMGRASPAAETYGRNLNGACPRR
jgi:hypothetical protein